MKILVLSPFVYGSAVGHGGGAACYSQITRLVRKHEVHFLSFGSESDADTDEKKCISELNDMCETLTIIPLKTGRLKREMSRIRHLLRRMPLNGILHDSEQMRGRLTVLISSIRPDVVLIQFPQMAQYVGDCVGVPTVLDVQDAFSVSSYRIYRSATVWWRKTQHLLNWLTWVRFEALYYPRFTRLFVLTDQDRCGLRIFSPGLEVDVVPAAVDVPVTIPARSLAIRNRVGFVGSPTHPPNADAVHFFLEEIFPLVLRNVPDAEFHIAGKGVASMFGRFESKNVRLLGFVENIQDLYQTCQVIVVPLRFGGGVKIKTIEAMANGCPIVSTSIGAEETGAEDGKHILVADLPGDFADKLIRILKDDVEQEELSRNARNMAAVKFSLDGRSERLEGILDASRKQGIKH